MSDPTQIGPPIGPGGITQEDPVLATNALLRAVRVMAENATMEDNSAECAKFASAAFSLAQALIILDPTRLPGGATPEAQAAATPPQRPPTRDGDHDGVVGA